LENAGENADIYPIVVDDENLASLELDGVTLLRN
jgi:hypothetical protein